jgi:hypothetical protein
VQICDVAGKKPTGSLLHHADSKGSNAHKAGEWNTMSVRCEGDHIVVALNGEKILDSREKGPKKGRIGFQVAKGKEFEGQEVRFRNIRVKSLEVAATKE